MPDSMVVTIMSPGHRCKTVHCPAATNKKQSVSVKYNVVSFIMTQGPTQDLTWSLYLGLIGSLYFTKEPHTVPQHYTWPVAMAVGILRYIDEKGLTHMLSGNVEGYFTPQVLHTQV